jgi:hypothetical protein
VVRLLNVDDYLNVVSERAGYLGQSISSACMIAFGQHCVVATGPHRIQDPDIVGGHNDL